MTRNHLYTAEPNGLTAHVLLNITPVERPSVRFNCDAAWRRRRKKKWTIISAKLQSKAFSARLCVEVPIRSPQVVTKKAVSHHQEEEEETASWRTGDEA